MLRVLVALATIFNLISVRSILLYSNRLFIFINQNAHKRQIAVLKVEPLEANQNESAICLELIERTFVYERESNEIKIAKGDRFCLC